jgi:hypothetical protein
MFSIFLFVSRAALGAPSKDHHQQGPAADGLPTPILTARDYCASHSIATGASSSKAGYSAAASATSTSAAAAAWGSAG